MSDLSMIPGPYQDEPDAIWSDDNPKSLSPKDPYFLTDRDGDALVAALEKLGHNFTDVPEDFEAKVTSLRSHARRNLWTKKHYIEALAYILMGETDFRDPTSQEDN